MLRAFFDESGTHCGSPITVVAGFVGLEDAWDALWREWEARLQKWQIRAFHAAACASGYAQFTGWGKDRCEECHLDFISLLARHDVWAVGAAISRNDFGAAVMGRPIECFFTTPEKLCLRHILEVVCDSAAERWPDERLALVFERSDTNKRWADDLDMLGEDSVWEHRSRVDSIEIKPKKERPQLQTADALVYEVFREFVRHDPVKGPAEQRSQFRLLESRLLEEGLDLYDRGRLDMMVHMFDAAPRMLDEIQGMPLPEPDESARRNASRDDPTQSIARRRLTRR